MSIAAKAPKAPARQHVSDIVHEGITLSNKQMYPPVTSRHSSLFRGISASKKGSLRSACSTSSLKPPGKAGQCLLFVRHGHNFPYARSGATLAAWAERTQGEGKETQIVGSVVQWRCRPGNEAPSWCISRPLGFDLIQNLDVTIRLQLTVEAQVHGSLAVRLKDLLGKGLATHELVRPLSEESKRNTPLPGMRSPRPQTLTIAACEPATVSFQIVDHKSVSHRRTVFFIRHAESAWNKAQSEHNFYQMWKTTDHPLSQRGSCQAEALAERIQSGSTLESRDAIMLKPDVIYCSPLTRAIQTAVIALGPVFNASSDSSGEIVLMSAAREKKNLGGLDSQGAACGAHLIQRALNETRTLYKDKQDQGMPAIFRKLRFDVQEVQEEWWSKSSSDSEAAMEERLNDFMSQLLYSPSDSIVVVGHSHFFRSVFQRYLSTAFCSRRPQFSENLRSWKLMNCGVARVELDPDSDFPIADVELVLNTEMIAPGRGILSRCCCGSRAKARGSSSIDGTGSVLDSE